MSLACPIVPPPLAGAEPHRFLIRALSTRDAAACAVFTAHLDRADIRLRFGTSHCATAYFLPGRDGTGERVTLAAIDSAETILGILTLSHVSTNTGEIALIVRSDQQRRGIGRALLAHACAVARGDGLRELFGYVLAENTPMLRLARRAGFAFSRWDEFLVEARVTLSQHASRDAG